MHGCFLDMKHGESELIGYSLINVSGRSGILSYLNYYILESLTILFEKLYENIRDVCCELGLRISVGADALRKGPKSGPCILKSSWYPSNLLRERIGSPLFSENSRDPNLGKERFTLWEKIRLTRVEKQGWLILSSVESSENCKANLILDIPIWGDKSLKLSFLN